jgi:hypothetical protein
MPAISTASGSNQPRLVTAELVSTAITTLCHRNAAYSTAESVHERYWMIT